MTAKEIGYAIDGIKNESKINESMGIFEFNN